MAVSSEMWTPDENPMTPHLDDEFGERYNQDEQRSVYDSPYPENASQSPADIISRPYGKADPTLQAWPDSGQHTPRPYPKPGLAQHLSSIPPTQLHLFLNQWVTPLPGVDPPCGAFSACESIRRVFMSLNHPNLKKLRKEARDKQTLPV
jgi:hypothetical protein